MLATLANISKFNWCYKRVLILIKWRSGWDSTSPALPFCCNLLSNEDKAAVNVMLSLSSMFSRAYALKEEFCKVFRNKTKLEAKRAVGRWL